MKIGDLVIVNAPSPYANMSLNGSIGKVTHIGEMITTVKLVTGSSLGVEWQFNPAHIRLANKRMHLTAFGVGMRRFIASHLIKLAYRLAPFGGK